MPLLQFITDNTVDDRCAADACGSSTVRSQALPDKIEMTTGKLIKLATNLAV